MAFFQKFMEFIEGGCHKSKAVKDLLNRGYSPKTIKIDDFTEVEAYSKTLEKTGSTIDYYVGKNGRINKKIVTLGEGNRASVETHSLQTDYDLSGNITMATVNSKSKIFNDPKVIGMSLQYGKKGEAFRKTPMGIIPVYHSFL